ncbi:MAG: hypothetical protein IPJ50_06225 [Betaproteobacteria bacterium]|nr:hypothetical protein [Betaproteobacteria bacterium]
MISPTSTARPRLGPWKRPAPDGTARPAKHRWPVSNRARRASAAPVAPDLGVWSQANVHPDCHIQFEHASIPSPFSLVGKLLWFKATDGMVTIYHDFKPVAAHGRTRKYGDRRTVNDHLPPDAQAFFAHDRAWCLKPDGLVQPVPN